MARPGWPFQATSQHRKQPPWRPHSSGSKVVTELTHGTTGLFPSTSGLQSIQRTPSPTLASWAPPAPTWWEPRPKFPSLRSWSSDQHVRPKNEKQAQGAAVPGPLDQLDGPGICPPLSSKHRAVTILKGKSMSARGCSMKINILHDFSNVDRHTRATKDQAGKVRGTRNARASKPQLRLLLQPVCDARDPSLRFPGPVSSL